MTNVLWPRTLTDLCKYYYYPGLHCLSEQEIIRNFLWKWGNYPEELRPAWENVFAMGRDENGAFEKEIYPMLVRAIDEGTEEERLFALFLLGGWDGVESRDLLFSFLTSPRRKERWMNGISLGRLKDDRVFDLLQRFLLEEFSPLASHEDMGTIQKAFLAFKQDHNEGKPLPLVPTGTFWDIFNRLNDEDYAWFMHQRSECAIILGNWRKPAAIPKLREAFQAVWKMERDWPDFLCRDEEGPVIWLCYLDRLAFALGQLGAWDALSDLSLPDQHLLVAQMYLTLGALEPDDSLIFWTPFLPGLFNPSFLTFLRLTYHEKSPHERSQIQIREQLGKYFNVTLPENGRFLIQIKEHLGKYFHLTLQEQEAYIQNFLMAEQN